MSDSISGVIIPLIIPVDAPPSLASGVQALAASLESTEFSSACLQLQQSFCYLTWHFADFSARHLQHLGLERTPCSAFGHSRLDQHLQALQENLERLAQAAEKHPEVGDVFRVFYVGGLRARSSSPRRHTRLLGLGGQSIRGYRSVLEWCRLEVGDEEFSGELRCQRELRRYLPILREWLDSSSGHFRQIKNYDWFDQSSTEPASGVEPQAAAPSAAANEVLASLKTPASEAPAVTTLTSFPTPPLFARHQALFEEQVASQAPEAFVTLGRLAGLAVQYLFAISAAALRSIGQLDPALEKRLETGLTMRQKQTSLTFLYKGLAQHQNENPMLEQVSRTVQAPSGGKLADFLSSTWGGGHTFAEFCLEIAKPEPPPLWQERFLPGIRAWLQQSAAWFAHAEHYFQPPNEQGFVSFTLQLGDEHLEIDRKALQLDTAALRLSATEVKQMLLARTEASGEGLPTVEAAKTESEAAAKETEEAKAATKAEAEKAEAEAAAEAEAEKAEAEAAAKAEAEKAEAEAAAKAEAEKAKAEAAAKAEAEKAEALATARIQPSENQNWSGPALALELWNQSVESREADPLLRLLAFLIQYTSGVTAEWRELEEKGAPENISLALEQLLSRLEESDDTPVIQPLGEASDAQSLHSWLRSPELRIWLTTGRDFQPSILQKSGDWLSALQPFFKDSEQLFEDPAECGTLEGVVVFQDRFLEFVDHPIYVGPVSGPFWAPTEAAQAEPRDEAPPSGPQDLELSPLADPLSEVEIEALAQTAAPLDLSALPDCATEYYASIWSAEPLSLEGLAAALEFSIQYYAGLLASVAIAAEATEASHLGAWRGDSNLLQRLEMIQQILAETKDCEHPTLASLREIFEGQNFGETWKREGSELASLAYALRTEHEEERSRTESILAGWINASRPLLETLENLAEPIDAKGHLEVVVQQEDDFFELVEPEYAIHLVPPGYKAWQDLICYRNLAARYGSQELFGGSEGGQELSGSAVTDDGEDFFSAPSLSLQEKMMEALFAVPEPAPPTAKLDPPKPRPQLVQQEEETVAPAPRSELQLNAVLEQLLQKPAEGEAPPAPPPAAEENSASPVTAKLEPPKAPARLDAPMTSEKQPEFIVVDPPKLQYTIHYDGKEGQIHTGRIELKNVGGSLLKGTVKSNHPCLRVNPSVFRTNEAEINYWIDDSDRPSNMQKIGLSFHFSGQKVEVPMEKMLPDKKFKQLASKMLGFVKNLRQRGS